MAETPNLAYINPQLLQWARSRSGLSHAQLQNKLHIDSTQFAAWERGDAPPPFDKARKIAQALHIPFGYLFLSTPPDLAVPLPDLRTQTDHHPLSLDFLEVVNDALVKQDWYRDHLQEIKEPKLRFVGNFNLNDGSQRVAADIRRVLRMDAELRRAARGWGEYVTRLVERSEDAGILVMRSGVVGNATRRKLSSREFQGFALADSFAPVVFVNSDDFKSAQIFTLLHEVAHIWLGESAISSIDPAAPKEPESPIEQFCNRVAAQALVPQDEFESLWRNTDLEAMTSYLARRFWVSTLVILRRAFELGKISRSDFFEHIELERRKYKKERSSGGNYYRNVTARMGPKFTKAVLADVKSGDLLYRDAARLLKMKVPTFIKFFEQPK